MDANQTWLILFWTKLSAYTLAPCPSGMSFLIVRLKRQIAYGECGHGLAWSIQTIPNLQVFSFTRLHAEVKGPHHGLRLASGEHPDPDISRELYGPKWNFSGRRKRNNSSRVCLITAYLRPPSSSLDEKLVETRWRTYIYICSYIEFIQ